MFVDQLTWKLVEVGVLGCTFEMAKGVGDPLLVVPLTRPAQPARQKLKLEMSRRAARYEIWFAVFPLKRTPVDDIDLSPAAAPIGRQF
jgi:hypothetical protein